MRASVTLPRQGMRKQQRCFTYEEVGRIIPAAQEPFGEMFAVTAVLGFHVARHGATSSLLGEGAIPAPLQVAFISNLILSAHHALAP